MRAKMAFGTLLEKNGGRWAITLSLKTKEVFWKKLIYSAQKKKRRISYNVFIWAMPLDSYGWHAIMAGLRSRKNI